MSTVESEIETDLPMPCSLCVQIIQSEHGLLTTVGFKLGPDVPTDYALEGELAYKEGTELAISHVAACASFETRT